MKTKHIARIVPRMRGHAIGVLGASGTVQPFTPQRVLQALGKV